MHRHVFIVLASVVLACHTTAAHASCEEPGERSTVLLSVAKAEQAFHQMDIDGFHAARDQALTELPCLVDPLQPADAARIHVLGALDAFTRNDETAAVNALRSVLRADPTYALPAELVPEGHALRLQLEVAATIADSAPRSLPDPSDGALLVDGNEATVAPADRPFILQLRQQSGDIQVTSYVQSRGPLPLWATPAPAPRELGLVVEAPPPTPARPWGWVGAAGASAVAAGALWGMNARSRAAFMSEDTPYEDLEGLRSRTNTTAGIAIGTAALGVGFGTVAVIRW